jgi:hypothetical protein
MSRKIIIILNMLLSSIIMYGEVIVSIHEPIRFKDYNIRSISSSKLIGKGTLEIYTDNEVEDIGKKIVFKFPDSGVMTNKKKWIKVDKYSLEGRNNEMIISKKRELVDFYAVVDKSQFKDYEKAEILDGEYVGRVPIILSLYKKGGK